MEMSEIILDQECEYRFEVGAHQQLSIRLKSGSAEIFGVELAINKEYNFCDQKLAVFTWYGCILETKGETDVSYVSDETPMTSYMNLHTQLQLLREQCMKIRKRGPRVS
jgi:polyribonucleotide 5'-hydroxyl-kinase